MAGQAPGAGPPRQIVEEAGTEISPILQTGQAVANQGTQRLMGVHEGEIGQAEAMLLFIDDRVWQKAPHRLLIEVPELPSFHKQCLRQARREFNQIVVEKGK